MGRSRNKPFIVPNVTLSGLADKGMSVGRDEQGRVVFVEGAVPGDVLDVLVIKKKKGVMFGVAQTMRQESPDRVQPFCDHFGVCGGCKWQNLAYPAQLRHKEQMVVDALRHLGKVEAAQMDPILGAEQIQYYRNKLEFGCANRKWMSRDEIASGVDMFQDVVGFHRPGVYDKILPIDHCWLQAEPSNTLRNGIAGLAREMGLPFFDMRENTGLLRQLLIRTSSLSQTMVILAFHQDQQELIHPFMDAVVAKFPEITTLVYCINPKLNEFLLDLEMRTWHGPGHIQEKLGEVRFIIGPKSFFQTNTRQAELLYDTVAEFAQLQGHENVYDLYTGIGSIALYVAARCQQVVGIEEIAPAIDDARTNAELNGIHNAVFYAGDVKNILTPEFAARHGKPDLLITDPPRAGMHPDVVKMLIQLQAPRIVYVSCNPATQARDLQGLSEHYRLLRVRPVDMFPHTSHIESVALLELK